MRKLTESQLELLRQLPDDYFIFPIRRQSRACEKLERLGFAESDFAKAYKRTNKGKTKAEEVAG